jgi:microcystin-dependent protein
MPEIITTQPDWTTAPDAATYKTDLDTAILELDEELGGLGTASALDVGTAPGNVVQLDAGGRLPAGLGEVPPGTILAFGGTTPPGGYLECDGAALSRTTYSTLFSVIGTAFGAGDGSTTFNLPDLRGEFVRGWDHGRGVDAGRVFGSEQLDALQGHWHQLYGNSNYGSEPQVAALSIPGGSPVTVSTSVRTALDDGTNGTPRIAAETRGRNVSLMYIIKY